MTDDRESSTETLVRRVGEGDASAIPRLLTRHQPRLRRMIAIRLDPRLAARVDPSDVVQEALADAARRLPEYVRQPSHPFYPWLRQIAWERLVDLHRRHLRTEKRDVARETPLANLSDASVMQLAERLAASETSPSGHLVRDELRQRVRAALDRLGGNDREVLVLRHLEQLAVAEIAAITGVSPGAVKVRHLRALLRLRRILECDLPEAEL